MKTWLWVVAAVVAVLFVFCGFLVWCNAVTTAYANQIVVDWNDFASKLAQLDAKICQRGYQLNDIDLFCTISKNEIDKTKKRYESKPPPAAFADFHREYITLIASTSDTLSAISKDCGKSFSEDDNKDLGKKVEVLLSQARDCRNKWPGEKQLDQIKPDLFVSLPTILPKKRVTPSKKSETPPGGGGFVMPTDPYLASYVSRMQSLLREYKSLRGGLDRYIDYVKRTGQSIEGSAYTVEFDRAIAARQSILDRVNMISPPIQYLSHHQEAAACIEYGISAMCALKRGDYPSFHNMSEQNTPRLARIRRIYGY